MATYAIGDVQGCFDELGDLLQSIQFKAKQDQLWFAGDLVNRGPKSLEVLRFVRECPGNPVVVLGNHDLHLLAVASGGGELQADDTLHAILEAADGPELCQWLSQQKMLHYDATLGFAMSHAGLPPQWDLATALRCAHDVEESLRKTADADFYQQLYGNQPDTWSEQLSGMERIRYIVNALTRMRFCNKNACLEFRYKGKPGKQPAGIVPWFEVPGRTNQSLNILFGHWAALEGNVDVAHIYPLDTGCVWGGRLSALRLEDETWFSVKKRSSTGN